MSPYDSPQYHAIKAFWKEPDYFDGESFGLPTRARRNNSKSWCGYVGVPPTHPLFGKDYNERVKISDRSAIAIDKASPIGIFIEAMQDSEDTCSLDVLINVHGGLTYARIAWWGDDGNWYFGFDCSHHLDLSPQSVFFSHFDYPFNSFEGTYRDLDYVKGEIEMLAKFLKEFQNETP